MGERVESMNATPSMFQAGISTKFTKRHGDNFHDTTLTAASAAKERAEKRAERQADAIDKQQKKIEREMKKIEEITQQLHRQQVREAKRLRDRLHFAATRVQRAFRQSQRRWRIVQCAAAVCIQRRWRSIAARARTAARRIELHERKLVAAATMLTRYARGFVCRLGYERLCIDRAYAATLIQSVARMVRSRGAFKRQKQARYDLQLRHSAAVHIQSHVRCFMTRLIYLDVLYVIERIQAVVRGFLVRCRLHWVASLDIDSICKFQALARGFLTRKRLQQQRSKSVVRLNRQPTKSETATPPAVLRQFSDRNVRFAGARDRTGSVAGADALLNGTSDTSFNRRRHSVAPTEHEQRLRAKAAHQWLQLENAVKRSYWLPAGASIAKRLPVLSVKRAAVVESDSDDDSTSTNGGSVLLDATALQARAMLGARTPKKRNQRNRPLRLVPVTLPSSAPSIALPSTKSSSSATGSLSARLLTEESESEMARADRVRREEALKLKLQTRKLQDRRRLELEQRERREHESEGSERKLMEREEKLARLLLKVTHRRSKAVQIKKQSAEQQREERERIAMARDERQTRLQLKLAARHAQQLKRSTATTTTGVTNAVASGTDSAAAAAVATPVSVRGSQSRTAQHSKGATTKSKRASASDPQDDDDDMSFLDIDFKIPDAMQKRERKRIVASGKNKFEQKAGASGGGAKSRSQQTGAASLAESSSGTQRATGDDVDNNDDETANHNDDDNDNHNDDANGNGNDDGEGDAFDYGSDFDEIIDETTLAKLIAKS